MKAEKAAEALQRIAAGIERGVVRVAQEGAERLKERAEELSSGPATPADLRQAGHPYGRKGGPKQQKGRADFPPEVINIGQGDFVSAWGFRVDLTDADVITGEVFNTDPKAELLEAGTDRMLARPLPEAVLAEMERPLRKHVERSIKDLLRF